MRKQLIIISSLTALVQALGFLKLWIIARLFGISPELDGYYLALVVPTLISGILGGLLQTSLFPVRAKLAATKGALVTARFERGVLMLLFVIGVVVATICFMAGPLLIHWNGNQLTSSVSKAALTVLPFAVVLIPLNAVGDGLGYMLAMRDRYPVAAAAPIVNASFGTTLLVLWPEGGLLSLAFGTAIGLALQVAICLVALARTNFNFLGLLPSRGEFRAEWREMGLLCAWIFPGVVFSNLTATLPVVLIAAYGEGAVSAFSYASRFHQLAIQLFIMAASPVLIARFAQLVVDGNEVAIRNLLKKAVWLSTGIGAFSVIMIYFIGQPLLLIVFSGRFDDIAARSVWEYWLWLGLSLAPALLGNVFAKVWQARGRAGFMSLLAGFGLLVFFLVHQSLSHILQSHAVVAAMGVSSLAVTLVGWKVAWQPVATKVELV